MSEEPRTTHGGWMAAWEFPRIFRAARMAADPWKLLLALAALVLTFLWAGALDAIWVWSGRGVQPNAIAEYRSGEPPAVSEAKGNYGIAALWRNKSLQGVREAMSAAIRLDGVGPGSFTDSLGDVCVATGWLIKRHFFFALLLLAGVLAIWSLLGGAVCRMAAVQYARDEKVGLSPALRFAREKFVSGFFISPLLPLLIMAVAGLLMALGGAALAIPAVGNIFALLFPLALIGGVVIAFLIIGSIGGGSLFWPTVAVEGSDGFDAISRSFSYFFGRPAKAVFYGLVAIVWGSICFLVLHFGIWLTLRAVHACLRFGASGFGTGWWGMRPGAGEGMSKLDVLWQRPEMGDLFAFGDWGHMGPLEKFAAVVIGLFAVLVVGVLWAFLASFFFSASTIIYYILRHDVDATDYDDVYVEEDTGTPPPGPPAAPAAGEKGVSLPVMQAGAPPPAPTPVAPTESSGAPTASPSGPSEGGQ